MKITFTIDVPKLKTTKDGQDFGKNLCEHLVDTFNDDDSIKSLSYSVPKQGRDS